MTFTACPRITFYDAPAGAWEGLINALSRLQGSLERVLGEDLMRLEQRHIEAAIPAAMELLGKKQALSVFRQVLDARGMFLDAGISEAARQWCRQMLIALETACAQRRIALTLLVAAHFPISKEYLTLLRTIWQVQEVIMDKMDVFYDFTFADVHTWTIRRWLYSMPREFADPTSASHRIRLAALYIYAYGAEEGMAHLRRRIRASRFILLA